MIKICEICNKKFESDSFNRVKDKGYAVLDYLAILPQYRNSKL